MIWKQESEQEPRPYESFSSKVRRLAEERGWKQSDLIRESNLSKVTVSRIWRDSNDKGSTYRPTDEVVIAVALAFKMNYEEYTDLVKISFPEREIWYEALHTHIDVHDINIILHNQGLPVLGNVEEE